MLQLRLEHNDQPYHRTRPMCWGAWHLCSFQSILSGDARRPVNFRFIPLFMSFSSPCCPGKQFSQLTIIRNRWDAVSDYTLWRIQSTGVSHLILCTWMACILRSRNTLTIITLKAIEVPCNVFSTFISNFVTKSAMLIIVINVIIYWCQVCSLLHVTQLHSSCWCVGNISRRKGLNDRLTFAITIRTTLLLFWCT